MEEREIVCGESEKSVDQEQQKTETETKQEPKISLVFVILAASLEMSPLLVALVLPTLVDYAITQITAMITSYPKEEITGIDSSMAMLIGELVCIAIGVGVCQARRNLRLKWLGIVVVSMTILATWLNIKSTNSVVVVDNSLELCGALIYGYSMQWWLFFTRQLSARMIGRYTERLCSRMVKEACK